MKQRARASLFFIPLAAVLLFLTACGMVAPPQPPSLHLPQPVTDLTAIRVGNDVHLHWTMPKRSTDRVLLEDDQDAHICRSLANGSCDPAGDAKFAPEKVADFTSSGKPAPWLSRANATPVDRQYGFTNVDDMTVRLPLAEGSWKAIGLKGPMTSVDGKKPDFGGSHMLSTAVQPSGRNVHVGMVDDDTLARGPDGAPVHEPVWDFLIFP